MKTWAVLVIDMYSYDPEDGEITVTGFRSEAEAEEYARRRTRDSVEEQRKLLMSKEELRRRWTMFGEDCLVVGGSYKGSSELDRFLEKRASRAQRDWMSLDPSRR